VQFSIYGIIKNADDAIWVEDDHRDGASSSALYAGVIYGTALLVSDSPADCVVLVCKGRNVRPVCAIFLQNRARALLQIVLMCSLAVSCLLVTVGFLILSIGCCAYAKHKGQPQFDPTHTEVNMESAV